MSVEEKKEFDLNKKVHVNLDKQGTKDKVLDALDDKDTGMGTQNDLGKFRSYRPKG